MPRNVTLPDGRVLVIPDDATADQLAALKNKLSAQYANITTGEGMQDRATQQARSQLLTSNAPQENYTSLAMTSPKQGLESGLPSPAQDPQNASAMRTGAAIG